MASIPDRQILNDMKRPELQKLCKEHQLRANLSNHDLIAALINLNDRDGAESDAQPPTPYTAPPTPTPAPLQRTSSRRTVSRALSRSASIVDNGKPQSNVENHQPEPAAVASPARATKAKQQTRLGVGRPVAAGGKGARAVTKSLSMAKRGKAASRTVKPEATIPEEGSVEQSPVPQSSFDFRFDMTNGAGPSGTQLPAQPSAQDLSAIVANLSSQVSQNSQELTRFVSGQHAVQPVQPMDPQPAIAAAIRPLQEQLQTLQSEMFSIRSMYTAEVTALKGQLAQAQTAITSLSSQLSELKPVVTKVRGDVAISVAHNGQLHAHAFDIQQLKEKVAILSRAQPSAGPSRSASPGSVRAIFPAQRAITQQQNVSSTPGRARARMDSHAPQAPSPAPGPSSDHPGYAPVTLGKHRRDSTASASTEVVEASQASQIPQAQLSHHIVLPDRKRARTVPDNESSAEDDPPLPNDDSIILPAQPHTSRSHLQGPRPRTLPERGAGPERAAHRVSRVVDAQASEDAMGEAFSLLAPEDFPTRQRITPPAGGTLQFSAGNHYFPMPETPQSPTPGNDGLDGYFGQPERSGSGSGQQQEQQRQHDMFSMFGLPSPSRPTLRTPAALRRTTGPSFDPAELLRKDGAGMPTLEELMETGPLSPGDPGMRTMYGTEVENNTRFADFGMSNVVTSSGFWERTM
ncbi:hypothetical protein BD626DRAFT_427282 [Schizophyllum amplum]|uniref:Uncharacterized protein n=1 Tax=Schizophyllum amplum TaxID=97359 RepID=A0A550CLP3_9AGAR|nr:hypothetical protein BD626DRAFT_427282 [Auriculariopsis ampla]